MRVFVDVGAHLGQTVQEVVKAEWGFRYVYAIEPMPRELRALRERFARNDSVIVCPFGLADVSGERTVYGTNDEMEASIWSSKRDVDMAVATSCEMVRASTFFRRFKAEDEVYVKLNCEGAEQPILDDLLATGRLDVIDHALIDFDVRKVDGMEDAEERLTAALERHGFHHGERWITFADVTGETHQERIADWLRQARRS